MGREDDGYLKDRESPYKDLSDHLDDDPGSRLRSGRENASQYYLFHSEHLASGSSRASVRIPNPRSWKTYDIIKIVTGYPPFPPPDIGPLNLPRDFFDDYPDLKSDQIASIKKKNFEYHTRHVRSLFRFFPTILKLNGLFWMGACRDIMTRKKKITY